MKRFKLKRKVQKSDIMSAAAILLLLGLFIFLGVQYMRRYGDMSQGIEVMAENMGKMIRDYRAGGIFVMILLQVAQVVIAAIPAALVQFVSGLVYGTLWSAVISEIGVFLGSLVAFYVARLFGKRIVSLFVSPPTIAKVEKMMASRSSSLVLFAMFLIPGFPKDLLAYAVGLVNYKAPRFFIISAIGRLPSIIVSSYLGAHIADGSKTPVIIAAAASCVIFFLLYIFKDKLFALVSKKEKSGQ